jgi:putative alpha-1,2-mannosidase
MDKRQLTHEQRKQIMKYRLLGYSTVFIHKDSDFLVPAYADFVLADVVEEIELDAKIRRLRERRANTMASASVSGDDSV